jgi:hypothetical protein
MGVGLEYLFGPFRRLNNTAHNEPDLRAINLPDLSSSDQSIKLVSFQSGDGFFFLDLPRTSTHRSQLSVIGRH